MLEPSVQFREGYRTVMKNAIQILEQSYIWQDTFIENGLVCNAQVKALINEMADVCVLVQTFLWHVDN